MAVEHTVCVAFVFVISSIGRIGNAHTCSNVGVPIIDNLLGRSPTTYRSTHTGDGNLQEGWYRAVHDGKQFVMSDYSPQMMRHYICGNRHPYFIRDPHPDTTALGETPVDIAMCTYHGYPCTYTHMAKVRKCGGELQYYLGDGTWDGYSYCFEEGQLLHDNTDPMLGEITVVPHLLFTETVVDSPFPSTLYDPYLVFECNFTANASLFYIVNWHVNGEQFLKQGPTNDTENLHLLESQLLDGGITLGFTLQCNVSWSDIENGTYSDPTESHEFFAGVTLESEDIVIRKGSNGEIRMSSTIPIGCKYSTVFGFDECKTNLMITNADDRRNAQCSNQFANMNDVFGRCTIPFQTLHKDAVFSPDQVFINEITTLDLNYEDDLYFVLKLQFRGDTGHRIWRNYQLPNVKVTVGDGTSHKGKMCYSHIDPHMRTADNYYYEQQTVGEFLLYQNTLYNIEIQEKTKKCNNDRATCACGIAIRAGKDVFMINRCGSLNYIDFVRCEDNGILEVTMVNTNMYRVLTPIGTRIDINLFNRPRYYGTMNIDIYMAPKDKGNIKGLCGNFDGSSYNDFVHSDGQTSSLQRYPNVFSRSWRLDLESNSVIYNKNLFRDAFRQLERWSEINKIYCVCTSTYNQAFCSASQYLNCVKKSSLTKKKCEIGGSRRRRSIESHHKELKRLFKLMQTADEQETNRVKREEDAMNITYEEATDICTDSINGSLAMTSYSDLTAGEDPNAVIDQCAYDVDVGDDSSWAQPHVESVNDIVKTMLDLQPVYAENNSDTVVMFLQNTCPNNCSDNGICTVNGTCNCESFYHGAECSIDERDPVVIDDIEGGGECDLADGSDCMCYKIRTQALLEGFVCRINTYRVFEDGSRQFNRTEQTEGSYEDLYTGECCVRSASSGTFAVRFEIAASNNGANFSDPKEVIVYDSTCQNISNSDEGVRTVQLSIDGGCYIANSCIPNGNFNIEDECEVCNSSLDQVNWTQVSCQTPTDSSTPEPTTSQPKTTSEVTTTTSEATTTPEPTTTTPDPTTTIPDPTTTTPEPTTTAPEHSTTTPEPTTTTSEPTTTTSEPTTTTSDPTTTTPDPTTTTSDPTTTTPDPSTTTTEPLTATTESTTTTPEPTTTIFEPTPTAPDPTTTTPEPTSTTPEPTTTTTTESKATTSKPSTTTSEHTTKTSEPTTPTFESTTRSEPTTTLELTITTLEPATTTGHQTTTSEPRKKTSELTTTILTTTSLNTQSRVDSATDTKMATVIAAPISVVVVIALIVILLGYATRQYRKRSTKKGRGSSSSSESSSEYRTPYFTNVGPGDRKSTYIDDFSGHGYYREPLSGWRDATVGVDNSFRIPRVMSGQIYREGWNDRNEYSQY